MARKFYVCNANLKMPPPPPFYILKNAGYSRFNYTIRYLADCISYEPSFIEVCILVLEIQIVSEYSDYYQLKNDMHHTDISILYLKSVWVIGHSI
jgi:hypothetical protein